MFELHLEQGYSVATMLGVLVGAVALTGLFYYRAFGTLKPRQWLILFALRSLAILIVVLLLFRPVFSYHKDEEQKPSVLFLLDRSSSMSISDNATGVTRFNLAREQVESWWEKLKSDFNLRVIAFADRAEPLETIEQARILQPDGQSTSLSRALEAAGNALPRREVEAVILLSDGVHNSAADPLEVAGKIGMIVHTVGVGASLRSDATYRDIEVTGINCADRLLLNNKATITASVEGIGLTGRVVEVVLQDGEEELQRKELTLDDIEGAQEVGFEITPTLKGRHTYSVSVPAAGEEKIDENNARSAVAMVVEPGIRVLYIEGTLRAEFGAIVDRFLAKDPDLEFAALVQTRKNHFLRRSNIPDIQMDAIPSDAETINTFDVFVLGDLDASFIRAEQQQLIAQRVRAGAGLVMLGGYHSLGPGHYEGTPLADLLPVELGPPDIGQVTDAFLPTLTPAGASHPIFYNIAGFFPTAQGAGEREGLPMLDGCTRVAGSKPTAEVLAYCAEGGGNLPVLAVHPVGKGRAAVFAADTTRKWEQGPKARGEDSPFLQFWGQLVRWLAGRDSAVEKKASIVATTDKGFYEPEEPIRLSAVVRNAEGEGANDAKVVARVRNPAGRPDEVELSVVPGPSGNYGGTYEPAGAGPHEIVVSARMGEQSLECEKIVVEVGRPNLEFEKLDLDEKMLGRIAADAKGRYVHISTAGQLIDQLDKTIRKKRLYFEKPLFHPQVFWVIFVGAMTLEWVFRKRFQLR